jgi:hypothetical protein
MQGWYQVNGIVLQFIVQHITVLELGMTQGDTLKAIGHLNLAIPWGNNLIAIINTNLDITLRRLRL